MVYVLRKMLNKHFVDSVLPTWNGDIQKVCSGRTLASVCIEVQQNSPQDGEEDTPRVVVLFCIWWGNLKICYVWKMIGV